MRRDVVLLGSFAALSDVRRAAIESAVLGTAAPQGGGGVGGWLRSLAGRPSQVVTEGLGAATLLSCLYRLVSRRATLLVFLAEAPKRIGLVGQLILKVADGVLVDSDAAAQKLLEPSSPARAVARIGHDCSLDRFLRIGPARALPVARRMVVVCELTPDSGAADLLVNVTAWSEAHPDQQVELMWVGEGDLAGLLAAQPLPSNLTQSFRAPQDAGQLAATFEASGLLVVPSLTRSVDAPVAEALAAGLPVMGSRRNRDVLHFVTDQVNGWLFDPLVPGEMLAALSRALATDEAGLDDMRLQARARMSAPRVAKLPARVHKNAAVAGSLRPEYQQAP